MSKRSRKSCTKMPWFTLVLAIFQTASKKRRRKTLLQIRFCCCSSALQICILDFCFDCFVIPWIEFDICKTNKMNDAALTWMLLLANLTRGVHENYSIKVLEVLCFHLYSRWKSMWRPREQEQICCGRKKNRSCLLFALKSCAAVWPLRPLKIAA